MTFRWGQIAGVSGILFIVIFIAGVLIQGDVATYDDGGEKVATWFADNGDTFLIGDFITGIAFIFFYFPFLVGLYARLRAAEGEPAMFSRVSLIGGIIFPVAGLAGGVPLAGLALLEGDVSPDVAALAAATSAHSFVIASAVMAIVLGAAGIVILRTRAFWTWLGWLALLLAIAGVIGSASSIENDPEGVLATFSFISGIGFAVFIIASAIGMLRSAEAPS
jgi:hypothetical protein